MQNEEHNNWRTRLDELEGKAPSWERMQQHLNQPGKKKRLAGWYYYVAAACLTGVILFFAVKQDDTKNNIVVNSKDHPGKTNTIQPTIFADTSKASATITATAAKKESIAMKNISFKTSSPNIIKDKPVSNDTLNDDVAAFVIDTIATVAIATKTDTVIQPITLAKAIKKKMKVIHISDLSKPVAEELNTADNRSPLHIKLNNNDIFSSQGKPAQGN